jgi:glutamyl-tRNA synthetase
VTLLIPIFADRVQTLKELVSSIVYFYKDYDTFDEKAAKKHLRPVAKQPLMLVKDKLAKLAKWQSDSIQAAIDETAAELEVGMGKVGMPLRVAVTGAGQSPNLDLTLLYIGKDRVLARIDQALAFIGEREAQG